MSSCIPVISFIHPVIKTKKLNMRQSSIIITLLQAFLHGIQMHHLNKSLYQSKHLNIFISALFLNHRRNNRTRIITTTIIPSNPFNLFRYILTQCLKNTSILQNHSPQTHHFSFFHLTTTRTPLVFTLSTFRFNQIRPQPLQADLRDLIQYSQTLIIIPIFNVQLTGIPFCFTNPPFRIDIDIANTSTIIITNRIRINNIQLTLT
ncbi:hypothetical protein Hanom_Chr17g01536301 [Helianthus anomalus]